MVTAEITVVGGGIAGTAACIALGRSGCTPFWIAPPPPSGERVGESLSPAANPILETLGLERLVACDAHRRSNATYAAWGTDRLTERNAILHLEGPGLVLDRARFEEDLRAAAGGITAHPAGLRQARRTNGGWRLELDDGAQVGARFVLDATGRAAVIAREQAIRRRADQLVAACAFLAHRDESVEPTPATVIETVADGWWYAALLPDRRLAVNLYTDPDLLPRALSRDIERWRALLAATVWIRRWIEDAGFAVETPPELASAGTTWLDPVAGDGWAAIGDAAAAFDPLSSHGINTALWSAAQASRAAIAWLAGDRMALDNYAQAVAIGIDRFLLQRAAIYGRERRFADRPFWRRRLGMSVKIRARPLSVDRDTAGTKAGSEA